MQETRVHADRRAIMRRCSKSTASIRRSRNWSAIQVLPIIEAFVREVIGRRSRHGLNVERDLAQDCHWAVQGQRVFSPAAGAEQASEL